MFDRHELYFTPDAVHMLKLARNALSDLKVFFDGDNERIEWKYIGQVKDGIKYCNKLSKAHIIYHKHKMNVRLAAQTFSNSVADAIECFMSDGNQAFQGASGTIKFIRKIDRLFDLLNSRNPRGKGYKAPLRPLDRRLWDSNN